VEEGVLGNSQIDEAWDLIPSLQGEQFETKTGKPFTYEVRGNVLTAARSVPAGRL